MDTYYYCFGIVKGKMPKSVREIRAKDYESAIRQIKSHSQHNYSSDYKPATLFSEFGRAVGWCFYTGQQTVYVSKMALQSLGLMPKSKY